VVATNRLSHDRLRSKTLTAFFAPNALGNGVKWATCQKGLLITIDVFFITSCTFDMTVYGKAVL
jgi:hypothetical protein